MQLRTVLIVLCMGLVAACGGRSTRTVELDPDGVNRPVAERGSGDPGWLARLFGAEGSTPNAGPCPLMGVLYDSSRLVEFAQPGQERYANIAFTGEISGVRGLCRYVGTDPINMAVEINMAFGRGPAATAESRNYRYWVAVTRRGRAPIEKSYFDIPVNFPAGQSVMVANERVQNIVIPRANENVSGENFEILVGFDLTPEQLQFNRDGKRFRVNSGANATQ